MRLTRVIFRQHIGRMFKKHWIIQGQVVPRDTGAEAELKAKSFEVLDAAEVVKRKFEPVNFDFIGCKPKRIVFDETHPSWHKEKCFSYNDTNALLEGLDQAKVLTKTIEVCNGLPDTVSQESIEIDIVVNKLVKQAILSSQVFDAEQKKLPIVKDHNRPAWNFPRTYGITHARKARVITSKILDFCEKTSKNEISNQRILLNDIPFSVHFKKDDDLIQLQLRADAFLMSNKPLPAIDLKPTESITLPKLFPIKHTISLPTNNIYNLEDFYPVQYTTLENIFAPHTIFVHHDVTEVKNLYETEVTENQVLGRSLMKAFTVAASYARLKYGPTIKDLPDPVVLHCVNTDGKFFHFGMFQLNTLDLNGINGKKNVWFHIPMMVLFDTCAYVKGRPVLEGYNENVIKQLMAFYNNR